MLINCPTCATAFRVDKTALGQSGRQVRCAQCRTVWFATPESAIPEPIRAEAVDAPSAQAAAQPSTPPMPPEKKPEPAVEDADWGAAFADERAAKAGQTADVPVPETDSPSLAPDANQAPLSKPEPVGRAAPARTVEAAAAGRRRLPTMKRPSLKHAPFKFSWPVLVVMFGTFLLVAFMMFREQVVRTVPDSANVYETLGLPVNLRGVEFQDVKGATEIVDGIVVLVVEGRLVNISPRVVDLPRLRLAVRDASGREIYTWTATPPQAQLTGGEAVAFRSRLASPPSDGARVEVRFFTRHDAGGR